MQTQQGKFPFLPYLVIGVIALAAGIGISSAMIPPVTSTTTSTSTTTQTVTETVTQTVTEQASYAYTCSEYGTNNGQFQFITSFQSNTDISGSETLNGQVVFQIQCTPN
jgi:hypothetical protein